MSEVEQSNRLRQVCLSRRILGETERPGLQFRLCKV